MCLEASPGCCSTTCLFTARPAARPLWQRRVACRPAQESVASGAEGAASPGSLAWRMEASHLSHSAPRNQVRKSQSSAYFILCLMTTSLFELCCMCHTIISVTVDERCYRFSDCASCTANTNGCQWCDDKKCISASSNCSSVSLTAGGARAPLILVFSSPTPASYFFICAYAYSNVPFKWRTDCPLLCPFVL